MDSHTALDWSRWALHNVVAHPLLVLCPPLGEWLHDHTVPGPDPIGDRAGHSPAPPGAFAPWGHAGELPVEP